MRLSWKSVNWLTLSLRRNSNAPATTAQSRWRVNGGRGSEIPKRRPGGEDVVGVARSCTSNPPRGRPAEDTFWPHHEHRHQDHQGPHGLQLRPEVSGDVAQGKSNHQAAHDGANWAVQASEYGRGETEHQTR